MLLAKTLLAKASSNSCSLNVNTDLTQSGQETAGTSTGASKWTWARSQGLFHHVQEKLGIWRLDSCFVSVMSLSPDAWITICFPWVLFSSSLKWRLGLNYLQAFFWFMEFYDCQKENIILFDLLDLRTFDLPILQIWDKNHAGTEIFHLHSII
jgi:hypothetical protein